MPSIALPPPGAVATRIARLLRTGAAQIDAWVSTEAAVQLDGQPLLRPAVVVVRGDLPYDGIVRTKPLLVVEIEPDRVSRWLALRLPAVWGPADGAAVEIAAGVRRIRGPGDHLTVAGMPALTLPVEELLQSPAMATVIPLRR